MGFLFVCFALVAAFLRGKQGWKVSVNKPGPAQFLAIMFKSHQVAGI